MHILENSKNILIFLSIVLSQEIYAQSTDIARPGPQGIYLFLGKDIPCGQSIYSYKIERRESEGAWKQIAEVRTPETFTKLNAAIEQAKVLLPAQPLPSQAKLEQLFDRAMHTGTTDSLKGWILHYPVKIALGLMYYDASAKSGTSFQYRVTEVNLAGLPISTQITNVLSMPFTASFDGVQLVETSRTDKSIFIKWRSAGKNPSPLFMVHRFENQKPVNAGGTVERYTINDTTYFTFRDSLQDSQLNKELQYCLTPFDLLGNAGKSSQVVAITSDNFSKAFFMSVRTSRLTDRYGNRISWHFSDPITVQRMEVYRSEWEDKGFVKLASLTREDTVYIDDRIRPEKSYHYYLQAISRSGMRFKPSNKVLVPAFSPEKLSTPEITEVTGINGGVKLAVRSIDAQANGFRVFRSKEGNNELIAISDLIPNVASPTMIFVDSSTSLSGRFSYTYAIRSENTGNSISELSNRVTARPILSIAPPRPAYLKAFIEKNIVKLFWEDMIQSDSGIAGYLVSRRTENGKGITPLPFLPLAGKDQTYTSNFLSDSTAAAGNNYTYTVQSIDTSKKIGTDKTFVTVSLLEDMPIAPVIVMLSNTSGGVKVEWGPIVYEGMQSYNLYRYQHGQAPVLLDTLPLTSTDYLDATAGKDEPNLYYLTTLNKQGKESPHSEEVSIRR